jgi:hypothetical protein
MTQSTDTYVAMLDLLLGMVALLRQTDAPPWQAIEVLSQTATSATESKQFRLTDLDAMPDAEVNRCWHDVLGVAVRTVAWLDAQP